jgi:hypothetical protein
MSVGAVAAQIFTVSSVLGSLEAERCQSGPRHVPRLHGWVSGRVVGVDPDVLC